jgi:hypothetical protein
LAEALDFLNEPDFMPAASDPARMEFDGRRHFNGFRYLSRSRRDLP